MIGNGMLAKPSIAVVDDDPCVLRDLEHLFAGHGFDVRSYSEGESLLAEIGERSPDCVLAELLMPGLGGLALQRSLTDLEITVPIVFLTGFDDVKASVSAMRGGAVDCLMKPVDPNDLFDAVDRAVSRSRALRQLTNELAHLRRRIASLSQREREVFVLVVAGKLNKQISATLGIAEKTVKVHRSRVMRKMAVRSVATLARVAERIGVS